MSNRPHLSSVDRLVNESHTWADLASRLEFLDAKAKGDVFERVVQRYLQIEPRYRSLLKHVWLLDEVPQKIRKHLQLPSRDMGIDLVAETHDGSYWAIQAKYRAEVGRRMTFRELSTFAALAYTSCRNIRYALVCTTTDRISSELEGQPERIGVCTSEVWEALDEAFFDAVRAQLSSDPPALKPFKPRPHQLRAIEHAVEHFGVLQQTRGKLIHPCGAGKTLTSFWIARELKARAILVAVPSLALIRQTLAVWLRESVAAGLPINWLCVCSDETAGRAGQDELTAHAYELGVPCVTSPAAIADWLHEHRHSTQIIFTTYQSGKAIAAASRNAGVTFDVAVMDEAHKTVGAREKAFAHLLDDNNIYIQRRIFMTATERRYQGTGDRIVSMDDPSVYGETFDLLTFKDAIQADQPILCDYEVLIIAVGKREIANLIRRSALVIPDRGEWDEIDAATLAAVVALQKAMQEHPIRHAVSFHRSIKRARAFQRHNESFSRALPSYEPLEIYHVSSEMRTSERVRELNAFAESDKALITNARCLTEGVDLPSIDGVIFADPKRSTVDIVQATGRALRPAEGKNKGFIVVPLVVDEEADAEALLETSEFKEVLKVLRALASNDSRIIEELRRDADGKDTQNRVLRFGENFQDVLAADVDLSTFVQEIQLHTWKKVAPLAWRDFVDAREFARGLGLRSFTEWRHWIKGELKGRLDRPADVPTNPDKVYADQGWTGWGDWLGTGNVSKGEWRDFESAREFARNLGLATSAEWAAWSMGQLEGKPKRPPDIPRAPGQVYRDQGWQGWGDWLGTGNVRNVEWRDFESARRFARGLGLQKEAEWRRWVKGELTGQPARPRDIPANPDQIYSDQGWLGMSDWLGTGKSRRGEWRDFESARQFAHSLELRGVAEWQLWTKGELEGKPERPADIPLKPSQAYAHQGWRSWGDWLGTGKSKQGEWWDFESARQYARELRLRNQKDWHRWFKGELEGKPERPGEMPSNPQQVYAGQGWQSWGDWLGTANVKNVEWRDFESARRYARELGLRSGTEWQQWAKGQLEGKPKRPSDIPASPGNVYADQGWQGMGDWLGTGNLFKGEWREFESGRRYVRELKLQSFAEWQQWSKGELEGKPKRPADIPSTPNVIYADQGWQGMGDWLGTGTIATYKREWLDFESARRYVRELRLRDSVEWKQWAKGELDGKPKRPANIPSNPNSVYAAQGWRGLADWLGIERNS